MSNDISLSSDKRLISFSQFYMWKNCPKRWKLKYVDNNRIETPSVAALFGTAMHEVLQEYLTEMYTNSIRSANEMDLETLLLEKMKTQYKTLLLENDNIHFSSSSELSEYCNDGIEIIKYFKAHRGEIFPKKNYQLVGIELPINFRASSKNQHVNINGFLDIVVKDIEFNKYYIYDFKTSTKGWGSYQKNDKTKISQLVLYKKFYAEQYNCDPSDIDVEYIILKRKIQDNPEYAAMSKRIQKFKPSNGTLSLKKIQAELDLFIEAVFNSDGTYNTEAHYPAITGIRGGNCRFCEFKNREDLCPSKNRNVE